MGKLAFNHVFVLLVYVFTCHGDSVAAAALTSWSTTPPDEPTTPPEIDTTPWYLPDDNLAYDEYPDGQVISCGPSFTIAPVLLVVALCVLGLVIIGVVVAVIICCVKNHRNKRRVSGAAVSPSGVTYVCPTATAMTLTAPPYKTRDDPPPSYEDYIMETGQSAINTGSSGPGEALSLENYGCARGALRNLTQPEC